MRYSAESRPGIRGDLQRRVAVTLSFALATLAACQSRELGESFADTAATHFDFYRLTKNKDGVPGWPLWYFEFVRSIAARHAYCDVNVAFEQELHLGRRGVAPSEASR